MSQETTAPVNATTAWLHDLRNAINTAGMSAAVARRLLADGDMERALPFLMDVELACDRCRALSAAYPPDKARDLAVGGEDAMAPAR